MRFLFVLILLAGAGIGLIYPWAISNFSGHEIGSYKVYEQGRFKPVTVTLSASDAPVRVLVDLTARAERIVSQQRTVLTLTAASGGRTALASTLQFNHADNPRQVSPQLPDKIFRDEAGVIKTVSPGSYLFTVGPGDADDIPIRAVDLLLRSGAGEIDSRAPGWFFADGGGPARLPAHHGFRRPSPREPEFQAAAAALGQGRLEVSAA